MEHEGHHESTPELRGAGHGPDHDELATIDPDVEATEAATRILGGLDAGRNDDAHIEGLDEAVVEGGTGGESTAELSDLINGLDSQEIIDQIDSLLAAAASPDALVSKLDPVEVAYTLDKLLAAGAHIDVDALLPNLGRGDVEFNRDKLLAAGASNLIAQKLRDVRRG